ncbi:DUF4253 domain-containing protein [Dactylosporangium sp. NPDC005555]|uniref:DUF4253 domain-containing protein n=1 Tax=Dactylosporangium sp. NPDC005555 TaxID=3154889 RepID=UPI0033B306A0
MASLRLLMTTAAGVPVWGFPAGDDGLLWWLRLRAQHAGTGLWPLLMPAAAPEELHPCPLDEAGLRFDGAALLADRIASRLRIYGAHADTVRAELRGEGEWRARPEPPGFEVAHYDEVVVALVPAAAPWQVPLVLRHGGWNGYPSPAEHAAILRYFHARYGAELVAMTTDSAEFTVRHPPLDRPAALRLAMEYTVYNDGAYDNYFADTLTDLAVSLGGEPVWRVWWD